MDNDEDSDSYASATEDDLDYNITSERADVNIKESASNCSGIRCTGAEESARASELTPALVSRYPSLRRSAPKRRAPQPPTKTDITTPVSNSSSNESVAGMPEFADEFRKSENLTKHTHKLDLSQFVSHPIVITSPMASSGPTSDVFSNLHLSLIDDISGFDCDKGPPSTFMRASATHLPNTVPYLQNYQCPPMAMVCRDITQPFTTSPPIYVTPLSPLPTLSQFPTHYAPSFDPGNVLIPSLYSVGELSEHPVNSAFVRPSFYPFETPERLIRNSGNVEALQSFPISRENTELAVRNRILLHSTSDSKIPYKGQELCQSSKSTGLPSLHEREEGGDYDKDDWQVKNKKKYNPLDRSDSIVTVAHLCEDLIVSSRFKIKVTLTNLTVVVLLAAFFMPNFAAVLFCVFRLVFGTLFPAYYSYKAVRTKNIKEYVKWMMYWIVFAFFTCAETVTDLFLAFWFPFYYEIKIMVVLWLLSPATRGSSILYRKFVHPWLTSREEEIDDCIAKAKQQGYATVVNLGTQGVNYATNFIMQTAIKGGGGIVSQLKRSYSTNDVGDDGEINDLNRNVKALTGQQHLDEHDHSKSEASGENESRQRSESESSGRPRGHSMGRTVRSNKTKSADMSDVYFHDVPEVLPQRRSPRTHDATSSVSSGGLPTTTTAATTNSRKSRSDGTSYATLPRTTSRRTATKKKQT